VPETDKNIIGRILQPRIRLVQLPRGLKSQLTKLISIRYMGKCPKYKIRAHLNSPFSLSFDRPQAATGLTQAQNSGCSVGRFSCSLDAEVLLLEPLLQRVSRTIQTAGANL
jgi:hypothetical protein